MINKMSSQTQLFIGTVVFISSLVLASSVFSQKSLLASLLGKNEQAQEETKSLLPPILGDEGFANIRLEIKPDLGELGGLATIPAGEQAHAVIAATSIDGEQMVDGIELFLHFDPEKISRVSLEPGSAFSSVVRNTVSQEAGTASLILVRVVGEEAVSIDGEIVVAKISFLPIEAGATTLRLDGDATAVAGDGGTNILDSILDLQIFIE